MEAQKSGFMLGDGSYKVLKRLVTVVLPALSSLYFGLAAIWDLPAAEQVIGTIALVTTFLGVLIGISSKNYDSSGAAYDGEMNVSVDPETEKITYSLALDGDPMDMANKTSVSFKVNPS